jgi:enterochelin esterase-like enzyme
MLKTLSFISQKLNKEMNINVFLPDEYNEKDRYPVLYILHGYSNNHQGFMPNLGFDTLAQELISQKKIHPLLIVAPHIDNSFGVNSSVQPEVKGNDPKQAAYKGMYSDYLLKEVIPFIDSSFRTIPQKTGRFIGGASMGGFAALNAAFNHPHLFSKVGGHMPAVLLESSNKEFTSWVYPDDKTRKQRDPIVLANSNNLSGLDIYLDCGDNDSFRFFEGSELLYKTLKSHGYQVNYHFNRGSHDDEYLHRNLKEYLLFYAGT